MSVQSCDIAREMREGDERGEGERERREGMVPHRSGSCAT